MAIDGCFKLFTLVFVEEVLFVGLFGVVLGACGHHLIAASFRHSFFETWVLAGGPWGRGCW